MRVRHFDALALRFDRSTLTTNPDGSVTVDGFGAHVGNYTYHDDKGRPFVEHVPTETLFAQPSMDSAAGTTLTIRHGPGLVTPDRYRAEAHGSWVKAWNAGDGNLGARLRLGSQEAIDFVSDAMDKDESVELSPVYEVDVLDTPGNTAEGHHDAVQKDRVYSGIAILGPNEARGGPGTRLQLDGPVCAPAGSRMQVRTSLDSAAIPRLSFAAKEPNRMTKAIISSGGHSRSITGGLLAALKRMHVDATLADQIETTEVTWQSGDEEPGLMVLPTMMWEGMLESIGANSAAVAVPEPAEMEVEQVEGLDADDDEKLDAKLIAKIQRVTRKITGDMLDVRDRRIASDGARSSSVNADAASILPPIYDYSVPWWQVCLDAIAKADPEAEVQAKALATRAQNGDAVAEGRLRQMLADRRSQSGSGVQLARTKLKQADAAGNANPVPPHERERPAGADS